MESLLAFLFLEKPSHSNADFKCKQIHVGQQSGFAGNRAASAPGISQDPTGISWWSALIWHNFLTAGWQSSSEGKVHLDCVLRKTLLSPWSAGQHVGPGFCCDPFRCLHPVQLSLHTESHGLASARWIGFVFPIHSNKQSIGSVHRRSHLITKITSGYFTHLITKQNQLQRIWVHRINFQTKSDKDQSVEGVYMSVHMMTKTYIYKTMALDSFSRDMGWDPLASSSSLFSLCISERFCVSQTVLYTLI